MNRRAPLIHPKELNPQQRAVVEAPGGPMLVIAGAGSGKTRVVTYRVARLIESGVNPENILLVTFTNKAAREMLQRVERLVPEIGGDSQRVWGGTFHHIGNRILRRHALLLGYQPNFTILDAEDAKDLIEDCLEELKGKSKGSPLPRGEVLDDIFALAANTKRGLEEVVRERYPHLLPLLEEIHQVAEEYSLRKKRLNVMDFDDLLVQWERLFRDHPEVLGRYRTQFQHILVDEYQDTNRLQADLMDLLAMPDGNLTVVGDDAQAIYSFRGADFANILTFPERYPGARIFKLEVNYRSTPQILKLANASIRHNEEQFPKRLRTIRPKGLRPSLIPVSNPLEQASFVARKVEEIRREGVPLSQMAVLYRAHYHSMELQMELTRRRIPYEVRSGLRFFEQAHIKDVGAYLKILSNPQDELAWRRVLQLYPRIGKATADKVCRLIRASAMDLGGVIDSQEIGQKIPSGAREAWRSLRETLTRLRDPRLQSDPAAMIEALLQGGYRDYLQSRYPNYESRLDDLNQLSSFAHQFRSTEELLSELALLSTIEGEGEPEAWDMEDGTLKLSSVHQAKGLEWPVVFIIGLAEGKFPSYRSLNEAGSEGEEEERRLFYVAVTRAKDRLFLCYPQMATDRGGRVMFQEPSRFLTELKGTEYEVAQE
jgi:DNA helicase-2/ATP-dependent DNA helicase PcrA